MSIEKRFKVSIAMAAYNGADYLSEQLSSFLLQTRLPDELVVCDDASSDSTVSIIEEFALRAPFEVRLIKNKQNLGYIRNFEKALSLCQGDLIFLSDQDDVWLPEKVRYIENIFLKNTTQLLVIHDGKLVDSQLHWQGATKLGQVLSGGGIDNTFFTGALSVVHKDLKPYILPIPANVAALDAVGHDGWIHLMGRFLGARGVVDMPLQLIRRHSSNTSASVASSVRKINKMLVLRSQSKTPPASSYLDRLHLNEAIQNRLSEIQSNGNGIFSPETLKDSLSYLAEERRALINRSDLLECGFLVRKRRAIQMLMRGDYRYFNETRSFIRDVLR